MLSTCTTATLRTVTLLRMLMATTGAAVVLTITACSGDEPLPTIDMRGLDRGPEQTIEALTRKVEALETATTTAEPMATTPTAPSDEPGSATQTAPTPTAGQEKPGKATDTTEERDGEPTMAPQLIIPTPSGPGICGRSPVVQQAILTTLKISSCRIVTNEELYRITEFLNRGGSPTSPDFRDLKRGDLAGLVNMESLQIDGDNEGTLRAGALAGSAIGHLKLTHINVEGNPFDGMLGLEELDLYSMEETPELKGEGLNSLKRLTIGLNTGSMDGTASIPATAEQLEGLPNLRHFEIWDTTRPTGTEINSTNWREEERPEFKIPEDLFKHNPLLEKVDINYSHESHKGVRFKLVVPHGLLANLDHLEEITIQQDVHVKGRPEEGPPLKISSKSPLGQYLTPPTTLPEKWTSSAQYNNLTRWFDWTEEGQGYAIQATAPMKWRN